MYLKQFLDSADRVKYKYSLQSNAIIDAGSFVLFVKIVCGVKYKAKCSKQLMPDITGLEQVFIRGHYVVLKTCIFHEDGSDY